MDQVATIAAQATASGIPKLWEWGGMVTLLTLVLAVTITALIMACWIIWQMYKGNQAMFKETIDAANRSTNAIEKLTEYVKGGK